MFFEQLRNLLRQLINDNRCPNCKSKYTENDINIIGSLQNEVFMNATCNKCHSNTLINAVLGGYRKIRKHQGLGDTNPITSNEVIEIHQFLENFDGDFKKLFSN